MEATKVRENEKINSPAYRLKKEKEIDLPICKGEIS